MRVCLPASRGQNAPDQFGEVWQKEEEEEPEAKKEKEEVEDKISPRRSELRAIREAKSGGSSRFYPKLFSACFQLQFQSMQQVSKQKRSWNFKEKQALASWEGRFVKLN